MGNLCNKLNYFLLPIEPIKKKGRRSIAVVPSPAVTPKRESRRQSMMPQIPVVKKTVPEPIEATEEEEEEKEEEEETLDISDLGPNPTPQMIELKRKKLQNKKGTPASAKSSPKKTSALTPSTALKKLVPKTVPKKVELPARNEFPGENCAIYLIEANIAEKSNGYLDFGKLQNLVGTDFPGAHLTFIHTPIDWR